MSNQLLVSTRKGLFVVGRGADGWRVRQASFLGQNATLALPANGRGWFAALNLGHFGVKLHHSSDEGRTFTSLPEVFDYYAIQGFVMLGQFPKSDWPARVVYVQDGTNEISFTRKGGPRHTYPGNTGYRLKVVSLEDSSGAETLVVLRSKEKVTDP